MFRYKDKYPVACPPNSTYPPDGKILYRISKYNNEKEVLNEANFVPVWEQTNRKFPPEKECMAKSLSFFQDKEVIREKMENYPALGSGIIKIISNENCGVIEETGSKGHLSLWDLHTPKLVDAVGSDWEEVL